ncbi:MAG: hypothetical protein ACLFTW_15865 [Chitinispirillaceae bacterium]
MKRTSSKKKNSSIIKSIVLLVAVMVIWFFHQGLKKSGVPSELSNILNSEFESFRNLEQIDSTQADQIRKQLAGFWTYGLDSTQNGQVKKKEYVEILDNGIVWQFNRWNIDLPSGGESVITHIIHGYIRPHSYSPEKNLYYSETRIIRQAFIADDDTCYGKSHYDEMWEILHSDGSLSINRRDYAPYEGDLQSFYPDNTLLDLVDRIDLDDCRVNADMSYHATRALEQSLIPVSASERKKSVESLVKTYCTPMIFEEFARGLDPRAVPDTMHLLLTLSDKGRVMKLKNKSRKLVTKRFDELAEPALKNLNYPALEKSGEPQEIELFIPVADRLSIFSDE